MSHRKIPHLQNIWIRSVVRGVLLAVLVQDPGSAFADYQKAPVLETVPLKVTLDP